MNKKNVIIVLCTAPTKNWAKQISKIVLIENLAACITNFPNNFSLYSWQNSIIETIEIQMLIKTNKIYQKDLLNLIKSIHPYQIPEFLIFKVDGGYTEYLTWIVQN
ncbi:MAG: divalent cation tolerance protein CutA [Candidatus Dasytiphilus stammeri]